VSASPPLLLGRSGTYEVIEENLGRGGLGTVKQIRHCGTGQVLAAKSYLKAEPALIDAFVRESKIWISFAPHPNIVRAYFVDLFHGVPHIVMEFIDGGSLHSYLKKKKPSLPEALDLALQICHGMASIEHTALHLDLKPGNLLLDRKGTLKITDFNASIFSNRGGFTGLSPGTLGFRSPEQKDGRIRDVDIRSDIFSFGVVLYNLCTGARPFSNSEEYRFLAPEERNTAVSQRLSGVIGTCLRIQPAERFSSFSTIEARLLECLAEVREEAYKFRQNLEPRNAAGYLNAGSSFTFLEDWQRADECFRHALALRMNFAEAWHGRGSVALMTGDREKALEFFDTALKVKPWLLEALNDKGSLLLETGRYNEALECFDELCRDEPSMAEGWFGSALALRKLGRTEEAAKCFIRLVEKGAAALWRKIAENLLECGEPGQALACVSRLAPDDRAAFDFLFETGFRCGERGDEEGALLCYREALARGSSSNCWMNLGLLLQKRGIRVKDSGAVTEAAEWFRQVTALDPGDADGWHHLGYCLHLLKRGEEAYECYQEACRCGQDDDNLKNLIAALRK